MTKAKVQHYVPQFLLRNFGAGKKDQVWVFDKATGRSFVTSARNIASESRFYDYERGGTRVTLEPYLSKIESAAKPIIATILRADSPAHLDDKARATLSDFLSIQLTRTKAFREQWSDLPKMLREALQKRGEIVADGSQAAELIRDLPLNDVKAETGSFMLEAPAVFGQHFLAKDWVLAATTKKHPFILGDNPLTRQNSIDQPHRGNLGLAVRGIEIYLPLSPVRALAMWCPSLRTVVRAAASVHAASGAHGDVVKNDPEGVRALADAITTGKPVAYSRENVENFNSLQVANSERYIFSSVGDFLLAKEMLSSHPDLKRGPRGRVAS